MRTDFICPASDETCPYLEEGYCQLDNPSGKCDDYDYYNPPNEEDEEEDISD